MGIINDFEGNTRKHMPMYPHEAYEVLEASYQNSSMIMPLNMDSYDTSAMGEVSHANSMWGILPHLDTSTIPSAENVNLYAVPNEDISTHAMPESSNTGAYTGNYCIPSNALNVVNPTDANQNPLTKNITQDDPTRNTGLDLTLKL